MYPNEDHIAHQPLTPNSILLGSDVVLSTDQEVTSEDEGEIFRKPQKYILKVKKQRGEDVIPST